jgi:hypothetical protein
MLMPGQRQWRSERGRPVLAVIDLGEFVPVVFNGVVCAELAGLWSIFWRLWPVYKHVADLDLSQHLVREISELLARGEPFQVRLVLCFNLRQVKPVQVRVDKRFHLAYATA